MALADANGEVRAAAAKALASIGEPAAAKAAGPLVAALAHEDAATRAYAAVALGRLGDKSQPTVEALVDKALDPDPLVRRAVLGALHQLKPPREITIPRFAKALEDADASAVAPALHTMASIGADAVPPLVEALNHERAAYWACLILAEIGQQGTAGEKTQEAIDGLLKAVGNTDPEVRMHAMLALGEFGAAAKSAAPKAAEALASDEFDGVRYAAAYALGKFGDAEIGVAPLEKAAESEDALLKLAALQGLARLKPNDAPTVQRAAEEMAKALASENATLRAAAASGLAEFGGSSELTAPALERAIADAKPEVIANAINSIVALGAKVVPRVVNGLKNEKLRHHAVHILIRIGPEAKDAAPAIIAALQSDDGDDPRFRAELQFALGAIRSENAEAVPELIESLASEHEQIRNSACFALRQIGPAAAEAAPMLRKNLDGADPFLAMASVWALLEIQPGDKELIEQAVPLLIKGLSHENELVRIESARALGDLGPAAKSAAEALEGIEGSEALKAAADEALKKIRG
jgi:HEAT repeat protein